MARRMLDSGMSAHRRRRYDRPVSSPEKASQAVSSPEPSKSPEKETPPAEATTIKSLMDWVGDSKSRAQAVLELENEKAEADRRKTLLNQLEGILSEDLI